MRAERFIFLCIIVITSTSGAAENIYMGQDPPRLTPQIFAPGLVSTENQYEGGITISPDGNECYFYRHPADWSSAWLMKTEYRNGVWTAPERPSFSNSRSLSPSFSPDGTRLLFSSDRNTSGRQGIWQVTRTTDGGWSAPVEMVRQISSTSDEWSCHLSDLGNMFVCSWRPGGRGGCDGWRIPYADGQFQQAQNLTVLNTSMADCGVAPGPNEEYVIFQSNRPGGYGDTDLYISFALPEGGWTQPQNLGPVINSPQTDSSAWMSYDGRYMFFSSNRAGTEDIYWVETRAFLPDPNGTIENKTSGQRFGSIQGAIIYAQSGDTVMIEPGIYQESIDLTGKVISLQSVDPNDPVCVGDTIIQGTSDNPVVSLESNTRNCEITGLTIRAGSVGIMGTATDVTIQNCRIMDNITDGVELFESSSPMLKNCLITANGRTGVKMHAAIGRGKPPCKPTIENCTIVDNGNAAIDGGEPVIVDSIIQD